MAPEAKPGLSPVSALCLRVIRGWISVVRRGKGGEIRNGVPYTRLNASDVQQQLELEQGVRVGVKTVQRALTDLVQAGYLSRRQLYKHRYNRTYWYAPGELEQKVQQYRPTVIAQEHLENEAEPKALRPEPVVPTERSPESLQALEAQITYSPLEAGNSQTAEQPGTEEAPCGQPAPQQEAISKAWGKGRTQLEKRRTAAYGKVWGSRPPQPENKKPQPRPAANFKEASQLAKAKGFGRRLTQPNQSQTWVEGGFRFTLLPSGHLVKDSLVTAPLR